jgi:hypothetical protein
LCDATPYYCYVLYPWFWISGFSFPLPTRNKPHVHAKLINNKIKIKITAAARNRTNKIDEMRFYKNFAPKEK